MSFNLTLLSHLNFVSFNLTLFCFIDINLSCHWWLFSFISFHDLIWWTMEVPSWPGHSWVKEVQGKNPSDALSGKGVDSFLALSEPIIQDSWRALINWFEHLPRFSPSSLFSLSCPKAFKSQEQPLKLVDNGKLSDLFIYFILFCICSLFPSRSSPTDWAPPPTARFSDL